MFQVTTPDVTPPLWGASFPVLARIRQNDFTVALRLNEPGTAFYTVFPATVTQPSVADVLAGTATGAITSGNVSIPQVSVMI